MDMYQKRKARKEKSVKNVEENNSKMNINCLTTVFPILLKNSIK